MAKTEKKLVCDRSTIKAQPIKRKRKSEPRVTPTQRSSIYRGVTRHRWSGRYEAHLWDKNCWNETQTKKGRQGLLCFPQPLDLLLNINGSRSNGCEKQMYLGAYDDEKAAAHAYDLAAMKYWGQDNITLNFPVTTYEKELKEMECQSKEEYIGYLRRKSSGFSRGVSKFRGVARHHHNGKWEARIGRVLGNKYLYLGTYATQEEAAIAYDVAAIQYRGLNAVTNFDLSSYVDMIKPDEDDTNNTTDSQLAVTVDCEIDPATSPSDEVEMSFIDHHQTSSSTNDTIQNLPHSPSGAIPSSELELMLHSPKYEDVLERMSFSNCLSKSTDQKSDFGRSIFPEEIQTYFDCVDSNNYDKGDDEIFGDLNSFVSSMFEFDLDV